MKTVDGKLCAKDIKITILKSRSNSMLTDQLLKGAVEEHARLGGKDEDLTVITVPTSFDMCAVMKKISIADAIVCLGAEFRQDSFKLKHVWSQAAANFIPISVGIAVGDTLEELVSMCGSEAGNFGSSAMANAIETVSACSQL